MREIIYRDGFAFVYLTKAFYNKEVVFSSLSDYFSFLNYLYMENAAYHIIKFSLKDRDYDLRYLVSEFLNYVMGNEYVLLGR